MLDRGDLLNPCNRAQKAAVKKYPHQTHTLIHTQGQKTVRAASAPVKRRRIGRALEATPVKPPLNTVGLLKKTEAL